MKTMTEPQRMVVERLLSKGWIEPLRFRCCVYLFLPDVSGRRQGCLARDWRRRPIRVTPAGNVLPGHTGSFEIGNMQRTPAVPGANQGRAKRTGRRKRKLPSS
jgi:hypothetical protein